MEITEYGGTHLLKELKLKLFYCGSARLNSSWHGTVSFSPVSRLYFVKKGSFYLIFNGQKIYLTQGNWYLIPYGSSYEYGCDDDTEQLFFHLNLYATEKIDIFGRQASLLCLKENRRHAEEITLLLESNTDISALVIKNTVMNILLKIIKEYKIDVSNGKYSPCVIKAINYINKNLSEALTIKGISEAIFVSESTLTKHFRKELNTSVNCYVDDLILTRAAQMVAEGSLPISAISNHFGFCDQFYFSRKFKAKYGITPCEYKRTLNI